MKTTLNIKIEGRVASFLRREGYIICDNEDYTVAFTFDDEWSAHPKKVARFIWNGQYRDVEFTGNTCPVPLISGAEEVLVGVYVTETELVTTTEAVIPCRGSIKGKSANAQPEQVQAYRDEAAASADRAEASADQAEAAAKTASGVLEEAKNVIPQDGKDGYTPVKGTDYYTEEEQAEWSEYIASELAKRGQVKPEFANSIEECTNTTKLYVLPDGYIYAYFAKTETVKAYTNLATEFQEGYRLNSSGAPSAQSGATTCLDYIPITKGDIVRVQGFGAMSEYNSTIYNSSKVAVSSAKGNTQAAYYQYSYDDATGIVTLTILTANPYVRFSGVLTGTTDDVIITVNEEIKEETVTHYTWANTGRAFVPADYEDRIIELEDDVTTLKNKVETLGGTSSETVTIPSYWGNMVKEKTEAVKALQEAGGKNCVSFAWAADTHIPDNSGGRTTDIGKVMAKMLDNCEIPFAMLSGDINTRASYGTEAGLLEAQAEMPVHLAPLWGTDRLLMALGNHDGCYGDSTGYYRKQFNPEKMWQIFFRGQALDFRRVFSDDGLYFYVDNIVQKTRFIVLNSHFGGEYAEDENGWSVNNRFGTSCYGQAQLDWLANVALDMPSGYSAIITAHVPPNITYTVDKAQFIGIVNAYCNKTTYSGSYTAGVDGWSNSTINVDFTSAKGEIIAMFTGHVHGDSIDTATMACPLLTILSAGATPNEPYAEDAPVRTFGTDTETSFDVVTINKATRTIYCTRVGAGSDREIGY